MGRRFTAIVVGPGIAGADVVEVKTACERCAVASAGGGGERPEVHALGVGTEVAPGVGGLVLGDPYQQQRETVNDTTATSGSAVG